MAGLAAVASLVGTAVSAVGTIAAGQSRRRQADYEAAQLNVRAGEERAAAGLQAMEANRRTRLTQSTLQARADASGFGGSDPTVLDLAGGIAERGALEAGIIRYGGTSRGRAYDAQAEGTRMSGRAAESGAYWSAAGTIIGGAASFFGRYGQPFQASSPSMSLWGDTYGYTAPAREFDWRMNR